MQALSKHLYINVSFILCCYFESRHKSNPAQLSFIIHRLHHRRLPVVPFLSSYPTEHIHFISTNLSWENSRQYFAFLIPACHTQKYSVSEYLCIRPKEGEITDQERTERNLHLRVGRTSVDSNQSIKKYTNLYENRLYRGSVSVACLIGTHMDMRDDLHSPLPNQLKFKNQSVDIQ